MQIGELARRCGVSASKIRFFEREGVLPSASRGANGYRDYPPASVESIALILQSQRLGFSLDEIRQAAPAGGLDTLDCDQILTLLRRKRVAVRTQLRELTELSGAIEASIRDFEKRRRRRPVRSN
jgi:MerR family transcriptional regulator, copper efflux regulator